MGIGRATTVLTLSLALASIALAEIPWNDAPAHVESGEVVAARLGWPAPRVRSFEAQRRSARDVGEERARAALHVFVDDALARALVEPAEATRVHALVDEYARRTGVRALADGSAVVEMRVAGTRLREAVDRPALPW